MASFNQICVHPKNYLTELPQTQHGSLALSPRSKCGTCDCPIVGKAFNCSACNSDLHPFCKSCPPNFTCPLHSCPLTLLTKGFDSHRCTVCDEEIRGVSYTCSACKFDIHPLCSQLPLVIRHGPQLQYSLRLQLGDNGNRAECDACRRQCSKWAYRCDVSSITLHHSCLSQKIVSGTGDDPAAVPPADHLSRCLGQPWVFYPTYHPSGYGAGGLPNYGHYGGFFSGQGYGAGLPNYGHYGGGLQGHGVPNYYNHYDNGGGGGSGSGFQNHFSNNGGGGSSSGAGGFMSGLIGKIGGSLAVGVLCNLIADSIQQGVFGN